MAGAGRREGGGVRRGRKEQEGQRSRSREADRVPVPGALPRSGLPEGLSLRVIIRAAG